MIPRHLIHPKLQGLLSMVSNSLASAATVNLGSVTGPVVLITGTTPITALGSVEADVVCLLRFEGALTLTHNATSLICPNGASILTAANGFAIALSLGAGNWRILQYIRPEHAGMVTTELTRALLADPLDMDYVVLRDDFIGGGNAGIGGASTYGELGWTVISITTAPTVDNLDSVADHPGIVRMTTATNDNDGGVMAFYGTGYSETGRFPPVNALTGWRMRSVIRLSSAASVGFRFGLALDTNAIGAPANGIYWQFDTDLSDSFFSAVCRAASTETKTASAVAGDTAWHVLDIFCDAAGTISFQIDGGTAITIATNVPTIAMTPYFMIMTRVAASAKTLDVDAFAAFLKVSR